MVSKSILSALTGALLLATTAALPSRTHCRCTIISDASLSTPPSHQDALDTPDNTLATSTSAPRDLCVALGPSLENLRLADPSLYESYMSTDVDSRSQDTTASAQKPIATTVLLRLAAQQGFQGLIPAIAEHDDPARARIECRADDDGTDGEAWSAYPVSWATLVMLQIVVALVIIACVAEGVIYGMRWMAARTPATLAPRPAHLRLAGEERLLLAIPAQSHFDVPSPGAEKKIRAYASPDWQALHFSYVESEEDELNRPVM